MPRPSRNLLQIHVAVLLFGLSGLFGKFLEELAPLVIVFGRVAFASLALWFVSVLWKLPLWPNSGRTFLAFFALGILLAVHWTTFFAAVQASSVALALITYSTFPVFVAFLEPLLFGTRFRTRDVLLALGACAGIGILILPFQAGDRDTEGVLWGVASGFTFALLSLLNRKCVRQQSGITIALFQDLFAAVVLLPFVLLEEPAFSLHEVGLLVVLGVLCTAVAHSLFILGLRGVLARTASMIACLEPVYGTLLALVLRREVPSLRTVLGGLVILAVAFYATVQQGGEENECSKPPSEKEGPKSGIPAESEDCHYRGTE
jgi:drug/metabolite transporter (DMT)-like permease